MLALEVLSAVSEFRPADLSEIARTIERHPTSPVRPPARVRLSSPANADGTVDDRLALHGIDVVCAPARDDLGRGCLVLMEQPLRGLIPLLDGQAAEPIIDGVRLYPPTTPDGAPLPGAACGRGPAVPTTDIDVAYDQDYPTDE